MKKLYSSIAAATILASNSLANVQTIDLKDGWNLIGSSLNGVIVKDDLSSVETIWSWDGTMWKVTSSNSTIQTKIDTLVSLKGAKNLEVLNANDGFWVNNTNSESSITLNGTQAVSTSKVLGGVWNLVSFSGDSVKPIEDIFADVAGVVSVWSYDSEMKEWSAWSADENVKALLTSANVKALNELSANNGYWISLDNPITMDLNIDSDIAVVDSGDYNNYPDITLPEAILENFVIVSEVSSGGAIISPLGGVEVHKYDSLNDQYILVGTTDDNGKLSFVGTGLVDGDAVKVVKDGYISKVDIIENEFVSILLTKSDASISIDPAAYGDSKPPKNLALLTDDYGSVAVDTSNVDQSITMGITSYKCGASLPKITSDVILNGENTNPKEISVLGAATITLKDANKELLKPYDMDSKLKFSYKLEKYIGDLESILNGLTGSTNDGLTTINQDALDLLNSAVEKGLMSFYLVQQQPDGSWLQLDKAVPIVETELDSSGNEVSLVKMVSESMSTNPDAKISTFGSGTIAYIIKTEAVEGQTKICFTQQGYRMNDGSIVTKDDTQSENYDFVNTPLAGAVLIGDQKILSTPKPTDATGCTFVDYRVPFLSPFYELTLISDSNFDKNITVDIEFGNLDKEYDNVDIYKIPQKATIRGYVRSKLSDGSNIKGESQAIVTLQDPQILTKSKVLVDNTDNKKVITLEASPNITYKYTLIKEDVLNSDNTAVSKVIKTGTTSTSTSINNLTQLEIENIIYSADSNTNPWSSDPYGNYIIEVEAVHSYANQTIDIETPDFTESMIVNFTAKVDEVALMNAFSFSLNQENPPYYEVVTVDDKESLVEINLKDSDSNGIVDIKEDNELPENYAIFGGKDLGLFKALQNSSYYVSNPNSSHWNTYFLGFDSDLGQEIDYTVEIDPYILDTKNVNNNQTMKMLQKESFTSQYMPFGQVYSMFNNNFPLINGIDYSENEVDYPLYNSGFLVLNTYEATYDRGDSKYRVYIGSNTTLKDGELNSVDDFSNILNFKVSPNQSIAYTTRYTTTEDNGYYEINQITPEAIPLLEVSARAEGTEYNSNNFRRASYPSALNGEAITSEVTPAVGDVLTHDFMLDRLSVSPVIQDFESGLGNWEVVTLETNGYTNGSSTAKWNVVNNTSLPVANINWQSSYGYTQAESSILPTPYDNSYAWMGDISKGTYSDSGNTHSNSRVATALKSDVIDFSKYSVATLNFNHWYEVSAYDAAWDTAFVGFEIQGDDSNAIGTTIKLQDAMGATTYVKVGQTYITRVTPSKPVINSWNSKVYYSNMGLNIEPEWTGYEIPLDMLAGKKAKIVFGFLTADTIYNNNRGWGVDNVSIKDDLGQVLELPPVIPTIEELTTNILIDIQPTTELTDFESLANN